MFLVKGVRINVIDLDDTDIIPWEVRFHVRLNHPLAIWRRSSSKTGLHVVSFTLERCEFCVLLGDPKYLKFHRGGKPVVLFGSKNGEYAGSWRFINGVD